METLKKTLQNMALLSLCFLISCGEQVKITQIIKLRVDSFISSTDQANHSELTYLQISRAATAEDRIIVRLPTNNEEDDDLYDKCYENFALCTVFLMPVAILVNILTTCTNAILQPANLTSAVLIFNTNDSSSIAAGALNIELLSRPWWHTVNWNRAHPFSNAGKWTSAGGDKDIGTTFDTSCNNLSAGSCAAGEIKFEMTDYFRDLISNANSAHYGMVISANTDIAASRIYSVQAGSSLSPRIVATYSGTCSNSSVSTSKTYYLGQN